MRRSLVPTLLLLTSCTLHDPAPELPTPPPPAPIVVPAPEPAQVTQIVYVPTPEPPAPVKASTLEQAPKGRGKPAAAARPEQVIQQAHQDAEVVPTPRGYLGNSAVHRFLWQPLAIYRLPVTTSYATQIQLPQGEKLASQLALDPEEWSTGETVVGNEVVQTSVLTIQPKRKETPATYVVLLTQSGKSFYLHLIPGTIGMLACTWEVPPVRFQYVEEPSPLPKERP